ncbi:MAG: PilZ domain-containing protein [FCB group bacterium]|jgi:hypothetical protein|nr:PilZ domain-containing protein [FCB group bacterium]
MRSYTTDADWDDPFDHVDERRRAPRIKCRFKLSITADDQDRNQRVVGPGLVRDISLTGMLLVTKHSLAPEQRVQVEVPTMGCVDSMCLPSVFEGTAEVIRAREIDGGKQDVALRFGEDLFQNMDFAIFIDALMTVSKVMTPTQKIA